MVKISKPENAKNITYDTFTHNEAQLFTCKLFVFPARPTLGAYIRSIDYLGAQENYADSNDNPGNKLIEFEELCNRDDDFHNLELRVYCIDKCIYTIKLRFW